MYLYFIRIYQKQYIIILKCIKCATKIPTSSAVTILYRECV